MDNRHIVPKAVTSYSQNRILNQNGQQRRLITRSVNFDNYEGGL